LKISSFPENRVTLINAALSGFFTGNSLPLIQLEKARAKRLIHWFNKYLVNPHWDNAKLMAAEDHNLRIRWTLWDYNSSCKTSVHKDIDTRETLGNLANHRLPPAVVQEVSASKSVAIYVYHYWDYKSFFFKV
jgi:hypothetical protein